MALRRSSNQPTPPPPVPAESGEWQETGEPVTAPPTAPGQYQTVPSRETYQTASPREPYTPAGGADYTPDARGPSTVDPYAPSYGNVERGGYGEYPGGPVASARGRAPARVRAVAPATGLGLLGLLTVLVGAWAGIVPFAGPAFGFNALGSPAWSWSFLHAMLWVIPGAVAVFCGFIMMGLIPRSVIGMARLGAAVTGVIVAACGAWLVIGPVAWPVLRDRTVVFLPASPIKELAYWIGYSLGPGLLLAMFGAFALGWALRSRRVLARVGGRDEAEYVTRRRDAGRPVRPGEATPVAS